MADDTANAVVVISKDAQNARKYLEELGIWDDGRKLQALRDQVAIPVTPDAVSILNNLLLNTDNSEEYPFTNIAESPERIFLNGIEMQLITISLPRSKKKSVKSPYTILMDQLHNICCDKLGSPESWPDLQVDIPRNWEVHGDLVLLPSESFTHSDWKVIGHTLWITVADVLKCKRVAKKSSVKDDGFRTPQVELLLGDSSWITHIDNGIRYSFDVRKCMFSPGNITEKIRVAKFGCKDEIVIDLYAGIGYFTLPYLVHSGAQHVHACEWNPHAVEALKYNLQQNGVSDRCTVHEGDNRNICLIGVADRVNLGLIPSSEAGWPVACAALKPSSGGVLHIHGNVTSFKVKPNNSVLGDVKKCDSVASNIESIGQNENCACNDNQEITPAANTPMKDVIKTNACLKSTSLTNIKLAKICDGAKEDKRKNVDGCISENYSPRKCVQQSESNAPIEIEDKSSKQHSESVLCTGNHCLWKCDKSKLKPAWIEWTEKVTNSIHSILLDLHKTEWTCSVLHVEHVKSYAPHINHMVADIHCKPSELRNECY